MTIFVSGSGIVNRAPRRDGRIQRLAVLGAALQLGCAAAAPSVDASTGREPTEAKTVASASLDPVESAAPVEAVEPDKPISTAAPEMRSESTAPTPEPLGGPHLGCRALCSHFSDRDVRALLDALSSLGRPLTTGEAGDVAMVLAHLDADALGVRSEIQQLVTLHPSEHLREQLVTYMAIQSDRTRYEQFLWGLLGNRNADVDIRALAMRLLRPRAPQRGMLAVRLNDDGTMPPLRSDTPIPETEDPAYERSLANYCTRIRAVAEKQGEPAMTLEAVSLHLPFPYPPSTCTTHTDWALNKLSGLARGDVALKDVARLLGFLMQSPSTPADLRDRLAPIAKAYRARGDTLPPL